jgi:hypothetical protein
MQKHFVKNSLTRCLLFVTGIFWPLVYASSQEYFQQEVNYEIQVALDDIRHELNGFESV